MAVTQLTHTVAGYSAINYALRGKPHYQDRFISGRVLASSGINCTVRGCRTQMNAVWKRFGINGTNQHKRRQAQRLVQSFDPNQLSYQNPHDIIEANHIGKATARLLYPHRQSIVVTQADNARHILHNHIITNMLDFRTGRAMTAHETDWNHVRNVSDDVIRKYHLNPTANKHLMRTANGRLPASKKHMSHAEYHLKRNGKYSWVNDVRKRILWTLATATNWHNFRADLATNGVSVSMFRTHMKNRKRVLRLDKSGKPIFKKHATFSFVDKDGKHHKIRDRKLGADYSHSAVLSAFSHNIAFHKNEQAEEAEEKQARLRQQSEEQSYERYVVESEHAENRWLANQHAAVASSISASEASVSASASASIVVSKSAVSASYSASIQDSSLAKASFENKPSVKRSSAKSIISKYDTQMSLISSDSDTASMYKMAYGSKYNHAKAVLNPSESSESSFSATYSATSQASSSNEATINDDDWIRIDRKKRAEDRATDKLVRTSLKKQFKQERLDRKERKHEQRRFIDKEASRLNRQTKQYHQESDGYDKQTKRFSGLVHPFHSAFKAINHFIIYAKSALSTGASFLRRWRERGRNKSVAKARKRNFDKNAHPWKYPQL